MWFCMFADVHTYACRVFAVEKKMMFSGSLDHENQLKIWEHVLTWSVSPEHPGSFRFTLRVIAFNDDAGWRLFLSHVVLRVRATKKVQSLFRISLSLSTRFIYSSWFEFRVQCLSRRWQFFQTKSMQTSHLEKNKKKSLSKKCVLKPWRRLTSALHLT